MTSESPTTAGETTSQRVSRKTMRQRRWRVWRGVLLVVALLVVAVVLSFLTREQQEIGAARERMEYACQTLQRLYAQDGGTPRKLPLPDQSEDLQQTLREHVHYNKLYAESPRPVVGVLCSRNPHQRLFRPSGRFVITFDAHRKQFELQWMNEAEFARRARDLGLQVSVQP